ncbi:hypothetical protein D3C74_404140 [compost metagenome]
MFQQAAKRIHGDDGFAGTRSAFDNDSLFTAWVFGQADNRLVGDLLLVQQNELGIPLEQPIHVVDEFFRGTNFAVLDEVKQVNTVSLTNVLM